MQARLLTLLAFDEEHGRKIRDRVELQYYDGHFRKVATRIYGFSTNTTSRERAPAGPVRKGTLAGEGDEGLGTQTAQLYRDMLNGIRDDQGKVDPTFVFGRLNEWLTQQRAKETIIAASRPDGGLDLKELEKLTVSCARPYFGRVAHVNGARRCGDFSCRRSSTTCAVCSRRHR